MWSMADFTLPLQAAWVPSLVWELSSYMLLSATKKKKKRRKTEGNGSLKQKIKTMRILEAPKPKRQ